MKKCFLSFVLNDGSTPLAAAAAPAKRQTATCLAGSWSLHEMIPVRLKHPTADMQGLKRFLFLFSVLKSVAHPLQNEKLLLECEIM